MTDQSCLSRFLHIVETARARVGVMGLGYVGLPLAVEIAAAGFDVVGFDVDEAVVAGVAAGRSHVQDVNADLLAQLVAEVRLEATTNPDRLSDCDAISICVPTPLNKLKDPDLSYVISASETIRDRLRPGQLVVLESTTFPGTTRDVIRPILEEGGVRTGHDVFLCFSPERVDPGNPMWHTKNTPKVIGGATEACLRAGTALYDRVFDALVPLSSTEAAELTKVYENTFRLVNIALANELAQACEKLDVDVWEVVEAAGTKPFGFMPFTPGPGLGGHCIPLDPHYLAWKMRTLAYKTRLIELASEINAEMPAFLVRKISDALNDQSKALRGSRVLVLGVAYKRGIDDLRESPALEVIRLLQEKGAEVSYHDPHVPVIRDDGHTPLADLPIKSRLLTDDRLAEADVVAIVTDHAEVDYQQVADYAHLVVDGRGVMRSVSGRARVVGLSGQEQTAVRGTVWAGRE